MKVKNEQEPRETTTPQIFSLFAKIPSASHHILRIQDPKPITLDSPKLYRKPPVESESEEEILVGGEVFDKTKVIYLNLLIM
jgi:hypothetical protein